jgi:hypothetical protein
VRVPPGKSRDHAGIKNALALVERRGPQEVVRYSLHYLAAVVASALRLTGVPPECRMALIRNGAKWWLRMHVERAQQLQPATAKYSGLELRGRGCKSSPSDQRSRGTGRGVDPTTE